MNVWHSGRGRSLLFGLISGLGFAAALSLAAQTAASGEIELTSLNGTYEDLAAKPQPIQQGPLTVRITSPQHQLTVSRNRLALLPRAEGVFAATLEATFEGQGTILADLETAAGTTQMADKVRLPRQTVRVTGLVRPTWSAEGLRLTVVESPQAVEIVIESGIARNLVAVCDTFQALPLFAPDCTAFAASLGRVKVPLPRPGETFLLTREELTEAERTFFAGTVPAAE